MQCSAAEIEAKRKLAQQKLAKMQCSAAEIEVKRKLAQQKLAEKMKNKSPKVIKPTSSATTFTNYINKNPLSNSNINASATNNTPESKHFYVKSGSNNSFQSNNNASSSFQSKSPSMQNRRHNSKPYDKPIIEQPKSDNNIKPNANITGKMVLVTKTKFRVELSGYNIAAIEIFKTIPTRFYDPQTKFWSFDVKMYDVLQNKLKKLSPEVVVGALPKFVLFACKNFNETCNKTFDLSNIDNELLSALMPFQEEGVCFGIDKDGRCLIADDMGLGKTFQALAIADYYKTDWPMLIVTTSSMKNVWEETIHKYLPSVPAMQVQYMIGGKDFIDASKILIVSHDLMTRTVDKLINRNFGVIIIDESHNLKNIKAKCTQAAMILSKRAKRVILLSGTPALSRPNELYSQLSLIDDGFFENFYQYSTRYCDGFKSRFGWDSSGQSNLQELEIILAMKFMIRRTKEEVLKSLPNKTQEIINLDVKLSEFSEEDRRCLMALSAKYNDEKGPQKHTALLQFFQETAKIKIPSVCSYILQMLETNNKFLVFAHHRKMLDAIEQVLHKKRKKFIRIDGNTSSDQRKFFVDKFQLDNEYSCAILSITAANAGITLTAAQLVLFAELHWNPSILSQAEARAHRIGQEGNVVVQYLLAHGTADDAIWIKLKEKQKILNNIGLMRDSFQNVAIKKHEKTVGDMVTSCLDSSITSANTLDISTYFKSPQKTSPPVNDLAINNVSSEQMDFLFDDAFDDILGKVELDFL